MGRVFTSLDAVYENFYIKLLYIKSLPNSGTSTTRSFKFTCLRGDEVIYPTSLSLTPFRSHLGGCFFFCFVFFKEKKEEKKKNRQLGTLSLMCRTDQALKEPVCDSTAFQSCCTNMKKGQRS